MQRIDGPGATSDHKFTEGSPTGGVAATTVTAEWLNDVQEELVSILAAAGMTPAENDQDQVITALKALFPSLTDSAGTLTSTTAVIPVQLNVGGTKRKAFIQVGQFTTTAGQVNVPFPMAYPTVCLGVFPADHGASNWTPTNLSVLGVDTPTVNGFTARGMTWGGSSWQAASVVGRYISVGY